MGWLTSALVGWLVHAAITLLAVRVVSPGNPRNTLGRGLLVTFLVAVLVNPFTSTWLAYLILPLLIGMVAWFAIYTLAYGLGPLQAIGVGLLQVLIGWGVAVVMRLLLPPR